VFDQEAGILNDEEAGGTGFFSGDRMRNFLLKPEGFGIDNDGRIGDGRYILGAAEDVDDIDAFGDVFEASV